MQHVLVLLTIQVIATSNGFTSDYSLHQLTVVPEEVVCTNTSRWGVPSSSSKAPLKQPVKDTIIHKAVNSRGISSTLYDPRIEIMLHDNFKGRVEKIKNHFK